MFIQWCIKGIAQSSNGLEGIDDTMANKMINGDGIQSNWLRSLLPSLTSKISPVDLPAEIQQRLTAGNLDRHIHDYENYKKDTPFISMTAGCVERDVALRLNRIHEAQDVALRFATDWGSHPGYLFYCWVVVGLKPAVTVASVAEEVRELNTYLSWSDYQLEGEVTAKIYVPASQILKWERWEIDENGEVNAKFSEEGKNLRFDEPAIVSNLRELL